MLRIIYIAILQNNNSITVFDPHGLNEYYVSEFVPWDKIIALTFADE